MMPAVRHLTLALSLSFWTTMSAFAAGVDCSSLDQRSKGLQRTLYKHALIADLAYAQPPLEACYLHGQPNQSIESPSYAVLALLSQSTLPEWDALFRDKWRREGHSPSTGTPEITKITTVGNVDYLGCVRGDAGPLPAFTAHLLEPVRQTDGAPRALILILDVVLFVPRTILNGWLKEEEMGIITLTGANAPGQAKEEFVAVRGTDVTRLQQFAASLNDLLDGSCVFRMASIVVDHHLKGLSEGSLVVVGHSLGGAAVQRVVHDQALQGSHDDSKVKFHGYSFNGVGLDGVSAGQVSSSSLYSYVVDGEIVSDYLGRVTKRQQAGRIIRYVPREDWEFRDPVARHRLSAVKDGICACLNGRGSVE